MDVCVVLEERFLLDAEGRYWSPAGLGTEFWQRYTKIFNRIYIIARVKSVDRVEADFPQVLHSKLQFLPITPFQGLGELTKNYLTISQEIRNIVATYDAPYILRLPGILGNFILPGLQHHKRTFAVELVGDPEDVFTPKGAGGRLAGFISAYFSRLTKKACSNAAAVSYVTQHTLQEKYPANPGALTTHYSSINLEEQSIRSKPRNFSPELAFNLITVGHLSQITKGVDILIRAMAMLNTQSSSINYTLKVVGDGKLRPQLEQQADSECLPGSVQFLGPRSKEDVFNLLDSSDVFVLATRGEGLPRVIIEAMARAVPVVATRVSGIPELVAEHFMVPRENPEALAAKIHEVCSQPDSLTAISAENLQKVQQFRLTVLEERRSEFYRHLKRIHLGHE